MILTAAAPEVHAFDSVTTMTGILISADLVQDGLGKLFLVLFITQTSGAHYSGELGVEVGLLVIYTSLGADTFVIAHPKVLRTV